MIPGNGLAKLLTTELNNLRFSWLVLVIDYIYLYKECHGKQAYLNLRAEEDSRLSLLVASVSRVTTVGMGDRVCVDLCNLLGPGEGLLVRRL